MFSISFWAQIYFFLAVISLLDITYLSKSLNCSETLCKRTYTVFRGRGINEAPGRPLKPLRLSVSGLGSQDTVLGLPGQPVKAARPSTAILGPLKLQCLNRIGQQIAVAIWVSYVTSCYVTSCSVCPGSSVALGVGGGEGGVGGGGSGGGGGQTCDPL